MNTWTDPLGVSPVEPYVSKATLPALARAIAEWFPELGGRSIPVSEARITRDNIPTLPLVMVSLFRELGYHTVATRRLEPEEQVVVEFWFKPLRYVDPNNGAETPFWAFYDYDTVRDRLVAELKHWHTPRGERLEYFSLDIDSDQFATVLTFQLRHKFVFCDPVYPLSMTDEGFIIKDSTIEVCWKMPADDCDPCEEPDPCQP